jgi:DnaJ-class molecular chaperone
MADEDAESPAASGAGAAAQKPAEDRSQCTPCRGTGKLVSNLGGTPHDVVCPWCDGSGLFQQDRDAQEYAGRETPA